EQVEVARDRTRLAARAAAPRLEVLHQTRIVEIRRSRFQRQAGPLDRHVPLRLVHRDVDARLVELGERALDARLPDEPVDVAELDAGTTEQRVVRALRP